MLYSSYPNKFIDQSSLTNATVNDLNSLKEKYNIFYMAKSHGQNKDITKLKNFISDKIKKEHNHLVEIGRGGEGLVFSDISIDDPLHSRVIKVYKNNKSYEFKREKIELMIKKKLDISGICWPLELINFGERVGYSTYKAQGEDLVLLLRKPTMEEYDFIDRKYLIRLSIDIFKKIEHLHKNNILLGDINLMNIMVDIHNCKSYLIDTDSFQVGDFNCPVGSVAFTAPEIQNKNFNMFKRTINNENFAIATLLFMIFHAGQSPYAFRGGTSPQENIKQRNFTYPFRRHITHLVPKGLWENMWNMLDTTMKKAFFDCFTYDIRPSSTEWISILKDYYNEIEKGNCENKLFPQSYRTVLSQVTYKTDKTNKGTGNAYNSLNANGKGFGILELGTKSAKLLYYKDKNYYDQKMDFNFNNFERNTNLTFASQYLNEDNYMVMNPHKDFSYTSRVVPKISALINQANRANLSELYVYGGAVFRATKNIDSIISYFKDHLALNFRIESNEEESDYNLQGYLFSNNSDYLPEKTCLIEWGASSFRVNVYDTTNQCIYADSSSKIGVNAIVNVLLSNSAPEMNFKQALHNFDSLIPDYLRSILNEYTQPLNDISSFIGTGGSIKRCISAGGTVPRLHNRYFNINHVNELIEKYNNDSSLSNTLINDIAYELRHLKGGRNYNNSSIIKKVEHRLSFSVLKIIMEKIGINEIRFSGTGVWYGAFKSILLRHNNE